MQERHGYREGGNWDAANLLDTYDDAVRWASKRNPPVRKPGDLTSARELARRGVRYDEFGEVLEFGLRDPYSRPRLLNGFRSAAKCYDAIKPHSDAATEVECSYRYAHNCEERFKANADEQRRFERLGENAEFVCDSCRCAFEEEAA